MNYLVQPIEAQNEQNLRQFLVRFVEISEEINGDFLEETRDIFYQRKPRWKIGKEVFKLLLRKIIQILIAYIRCLFNDRDFW
ncbi:MAG: hypothetical protein ACRCU2_25350 [Planktothrix sp.]